MSYNYTGPRGRFRNVELLFQSLHWDGPIKGICIIDEQKLYYNMNKEIYMSFTNTDGFTYDELKKQAKEFDETVEEFTEENEILRFYNVYCLPFDIIDILEKIQIGFEKCTSRTYGRDITKISDNEHNNSLNDLDLFRSTAEYLNMKKIIENFEERFLIQKNCVGWFDIDDIKIHRRRIDKKGEI